MKTKLSKLAQSIEDHVAFDQPFLEVRVKGASVFVHGNFLVRSEEWQKPLTRYSVEIIFPQSFPEQEPKVYEIENAIPRTSEYHVNPDGSCCVGVPEVWGLDESVDPVETYFNGPLKNYFLGQQIKQSTGEWPFKEYSHGVEGVVEAYSLVLGVESNPEKILYILKILAQPWPKGHWPCFCGSGKSLRHCCMDDAKRLHEKVPTKKAGRMLARLDGYLKKSRRFEPSN